MNLALNDPLRFLATHSLLILGFLGQGLFFGRFLVQWIASEKQRKSVVPIPFWYFSIGGGGLLLIYAVLKKDPVFILGQAGGLLIYLRNLTLIFKERARVHAATGSTVPVSSPE
jgi:lipid-A-disaccharide synthase-like uncharacterized protein